MILKISKILFLVFSFSISIEATTYTWDKGGVDASWSIAANWNPDGIPTIANSDNVYIQNIPEASWPIVDSGVLAETRGLYLGKAAGISGLNINGGKLYVSYKAFLANADNGTGTLNINSGDVDIINQFDMATQPNSVGVINLNGGSLNLGNSQLMVYRGQATLNVNGGKLLSQGVIQFPYDKTVAIAGATINLTSGLIDIQRLLFQTNIPRMDITNGTLQTMYFDSDANERTFDSYVSRGLITAFGGNARAVLNTALLANGKTNVTASLSNSAQAWNPRPKGRAVPLANNTLTWSAGAGATTHNVYFGTNFEDVNSATTSTAGIFKIAQAQTSYNFNGNVGTTYYWRIDEVAGNTVTKGNVWSFVVESGPIVENFEQYASTSGLTGIWAAGGGASVALSESPNPIRDSKAIALSYSNGVAGYSQAVRNYAIGQNWNTGALKAIDVWYCGNTSNTADKMYVLLSDETNSAVQFFKTDEAIDLNAVKATTWNVWHILLSDFDTVNLNAVKNIKLGVGDPLNPTDHSASGTVYFDDLTLYGSRCLQLPTTDMGDLNQDCVVDFKDAAIIAKNWLNSGTPVTYPVAWSYGSFNCDGESVPYVLGMPVSSLKRNVLCIFPRYTEMEMLDSGVLNDLAVKLIGNGIPVITFPSKWADLVQQRDAILQGIDTFVQTDARINCVVNACKNSSFYSGEQIIMLGTSRYGFATLHDMANNPSIEAGVVILPVTYWPFLSEFQGMENNPIILQHELTNVVGNFPSRNLYMLIATDDTRVSTEKALELAGHLRQTYEQAGRPDAFSVYLSPSTGHSWNVPMNEDILAWFKNCGYMN